MLWHLIGIVVFATQSFFLVDGISMTRSKVRVQLVQELSSDLRGAIISSIAIRDSEANLHCQAQVIYKEFVIVFDSAPLGRL